MQRQLFTISQENIIPVTRLLNSTLQNHTIYSYEFADERYLDQLDYEQASQWNPYAEVVLMRKFNDRCITTYAKVYPDSKPSEQGTLLVIGDEVIITEDKIVCIHKKSSEWIGRKTTLLEFFDITSKNYPDSKAIAA